MITKEKLQLILNEPLPGESAQWKLAPANRPSLESIDLNSLKRAAVMLPLVEIKQELNILLTLRTAYEGVHGGQVSFPGGKFNPEENNPVDVALRETNEEIGINKVHIDILGVLSPLVIPVSRMHVQPVVGWINELEEMKPEPREVQRILLIPWNELLQAKIQFSSKLVKGISMKIPYLELDNEIVWGATAMILSEFMTAAGFPPNG